MAAQLLKSVGFSFFWIHNSLELRLNRLSHSKFSLSFIANSEKGVWGHMLTYYEDVKQDFACLFVLSEL